MATDAHSDSGRAGAGTPGRGRPAPRRPGWAAARLLPLAGCLAAAVQAADVPEGSVSNAAGTAWVGAEKPHRFASVLLDSDRLRGRFGLPVQGADIGRRAELYLAARADDGWFMKTENGWARW